MEYVRRKLLFPIITCLSAGAFLFAWYMYSGSAAPAYYLLPLSLLLVSLTGATVFERLASSVVFNVFLLQAVVRYCFLPVMLGFSAGVLRSGYSSDYVNIAIVVMAIELFGIMLTFQFLSKKQSAVLSAPHAPVEPLRKSYLTVCILLGMFTYIGLSGALSKINLVFSLDEYVERSLMGGQIEVEGYGLILFTPFKVLLSLLVVCWVYSSRNLGDNLRLYLYVFIVFVGSIFVVGMSRLSMVLFVLPLVLLIISMLKPRQARTLSYLAISLILFSLMVSSIHKFSRYGEVAELGILVSGSSLNAYFAGPWNIAAGFEAYEKTGAYESVLYLINDTFQNVPILSKFTNDNYKLTLSFNEQIYGHRWWADQIVPLAISGLFHFGVAGVFVYQVLFIVLALYAERLSRKTSFIAFKYLLLYISITFSMVFMLNIGSFYAAISRSALFMLLPFMILYLFQKAKIKV